MKYRIENLKEFESALKNAKEKIDFLLSLDLSEKELNDEDIEKISELDKELWSLSREIWNNSPKIKLVSSKGTEFTIR